uniref:Fibroblast growth factor n=1 Tax=Rattus norvegicus TaxID=10116 RepID=A0ABK0LFT8_RAT
MGAAALSLLLGSLTPRWTTQFVSRSCRILCMDQGTSARAARLKPGAQVPYDDQDTEAHLEIREDGTVVGTAHRSPESLLELKALKPGVIQILGVKASRFLCQQPDGTLYGSPHFDPEACSFRELLLKDGYNVYQSEAHGLPLRLPQKDSQDPATRGPVRFLPMPGLPHEPQEQPGVLPPEPPDVGSSDPLSMVEPLQGRSPSYAS